MNLINTSVTKLIATMAFAIIVLFAGCAKDDFEEVNGLCPVVVLTDPLNGAVNVPLNQVITATFNEKMNPTTISKSSFTVTANDSLIDGTVTYDNLTATFTPTILLSDDTQYTGTITTMAKDERGNALQQDYVWTFTTGISIPMFSVAVSSNPIIGGSSTGAGLFSQGTSVTVIATPNTGYTFVNWTLAGVEVSTLTDYTFTLNANTTLVAHFTIARFSLVVTAVNGNVNKDPDQLKYDNGDNVILTPTPNAGYIFKSWSGDATGTDDPLTVLMDADKDIEANFSLIATSGCTPAVDLGLSGNYAILAEAGISTTGNTTVTGNMGISPAAATYITGFALNLTSGASYATSSLLTGKIYAPGYANPTPANLTTAVDNMRTAFTTGNGLAPGTTELLSGNLNGQTLAAGVYKWSTGLSITNGITLDGGGDDCAMFVFQIAQDLTVANGTIITLANGAHAENIYWLVAGSGAMLGTTVQFQGNLLSKTLISLNTGATINGRLMAQTEVTLNANSVTKP
jgi:uncharacterized repeat protein (TIGR02543 family)